MKNEIKYLKMWKELNNSRNGKMAPPYGVSKICHCGRLFFSYRTATNRCGTCKTNKFAA